MFYSIRLAVFHDIEVIKTLVTLAAYQLNKTDYSTAEIESALTWIYGVDTQLILDQTYFVAERGIEIIGCGGWSFRKKGYGGTQTALKEQDPMMDVKDSALIRAFFVHPDYARQGIGSCLLSHVEQAAQQRGYVRFETIATLTGKKLYASHGYTEIEKLILPVPGNIPFPAVKMRK